MANSSKTRTIDEIDDPFELMDVMKAFDIAAKGLKTVDEMKTRLIDVLNLAEKMPNWSAGQAFSILSEAKEEDARKRQVLLNFYTKANNFVDKMDEQTLTLLQKHTENVKGNVEQHMRQLKQKEYFLLVAGETSSGKSSMVNLILGEEILPYSLLSTTSTICELKFGEERRIVAHFKDKDPETGQSTKEITLEKTASESSEQSYLEQISPYVHVKTERDEGSPFRKIELFWPHSLLQNGIVIIDSPGVGESDEMDAIVSRYLPEAFAFIYVINSANAGGIQKDRLEKLLQDAREVSLGVQKEDKDGSGMLFSKCALFVCNKWDQVPEKEIEIVKNDVTKKLKRVWPGVDQESQIIFMSTTTAKKAQRYGLITGDFCSLMNGIRSVVLKSIEARLELHWRWLDNLLSRIIFQAKAFVMNTFRDRDEVKQKIMRIERRLNSIEKEQEKMMSDLHNSLNKQVDGAVQRLSEYLSSKEVKQRFTLWTPSEVPVEQISWEGTKELTLKALAFRFREIVEQWEEDNKIFANIRVSLIQQFQQYFDNVESQLLNLQSAVIEYENGDVDKKKPVFRVAVATKILKGFRDGFQWAFDIGKNFLPALPLVPLLAIPGVVIQMKSIAVEYWNEQSYNSNPCSFMAQLSSEYFAAETEKKKLKEFVEDQLKVVKLYLEEIKERLPELIRADKMLYEELIAETRSKEEIEALYRPIWQEGLQHRNRLAVFGVTKVCAVEVRREELDWKEDTFSCLGSGAFGAVYQGTMTKRGGDKPVALKVCSEELMSVMQAKSCRR